MDEKVEKLTKAMQSLVHLLRGGADGSPVIRTEDDQITLTVIEHTLREVIAGDPVGGE